MSDQREDLARLFDESEHKNGVEVTCWLCDRFTNGEKSSCWEWAAEHWTGHAAMLSDLGWVKPDLEPSRWWRVITPDGRLWAETSSEDQARERMRPGDQLERLYVAEVSEWRAAEEQGDG